MKKTAKLFRLCLSLVLAVVLVLPAIACHRADEDDPNPPTIELTIDECITAIALGDDPIQLTVTVTKDGEKIEGEEVSWTTSDPALLKVTDGGLVSAMAEPEILDKYVTITATLKSDPRVTADRTFTVKAAKQSGRTGYLTADMLNTLGNPSITVDGTLTDFYVNTNKPEDNSENKYGMTVEMQDGKWRGIWGALNASGDMVNTVEDIYEKGVKDATDQNGKKGKELLSVYLNKNNEVARKTITNYVSIPSVWEEQHLWNHLDRLPVVDFTYDADQPDEYTYVANESSEASMYLMTYLAYSLTPMMEETFQRVIITLGQTEEGGDYDYITGMKAQTFPQYTGATTDQQGNITGWDAMSYSTVEFKFSKIGETTVKDPTPFEAPEHVDVLKKALDTMKTATNYTFDAVDTTTYAPSGSDDDYTLSVSKAQAKAAARAAEGEPAYHNGLSYSSYYNFNSSTGKPGVTGYVTDDGIVLMRTIEYSASMDDNNYRTEISGYKQIANGTDDDYYEQFSYDAAAVVIPSSDGNNKTYGALKGTKSVRGHISDKLPGFDFSPNLFRLSGSSMSGSKRTYTFVLQSTAATRDIAMEISMHTNADSAAASSSTALRIIVDEDGNLVSTTYPYSLVSGTYLGYITTTFSNIGTTTLRKDAFNEYVARGWKQSWSEYTMKYYRENESEITREINAATGIESIFGKNQSSLPTPAEMMKLFGDDISGPFYEENTKTLADGSEKYIRYMALTARVDDYDENMQITKETFDKIEKIAIETFAGKKFKKDTALSDTTGGATGRSDFRLVLANDDITIVIENNHTRNFWIYFYKTGEYIRSSTNA